MPNLVFLHPVSGDGLLKLRCVCIRRTTRDRALGVSEMETNVAKKTTNIRQDRFRLGAETLRQVFCMAIKSIVPVPIYPACIAGH